MEELFEILEELKPGIDFENCETLIDDGYLDSLSIISLVSEIEDAFDVTIPTVEIVPDNFNSAAALWALIERLMEED
ncbi:MAG: acyl carrier protein [Firmicutes bacterium]|nr:acyl carrier protein [Bacillota bacterium]MBQ1525115.1 acyl carrier protein [Bacillota bacterium]MBQ2455849.1 acyl carrier protein [Bacillota bacterium]MBQ4234293.1 acyl carrier protein [Bacillota bacterium]MBQ6014488.1 acyl carrier protein [Bacillota bacterium]